MSAAFLTFIFWLSLTGLIGLVPARHRPFARLGLFAFTPILLILTLLTEGWLPSLIVIGAALTVFGSEVARLVQVLRELAGQTVRHPGSADGGEAA
jgi:hypothetical protein